MEKEATVIKSQAENKSESETKRQNTAQRVRRLGKSRDSWKHKFKGKQAKIKGLDIYARDLRNSRDCWKVRAKEAEAKLKGADKAQEGSWEGTPKKS